MSTGKIESYDEKKKLGFIKEDDTNKIYPFRVKTPEKTTEEETKKMELPKLLKKDLVSFDFDKNQVINVTKIEKTN